MADLSHLLVSSIISYTYKFLNYDLQSNVQYHFFNVYFLERYLEVLM